jgi:hypothetical protein
MLKTPSLMINRRRSRGSVLHDGARSLGVAMREDFDRSATEAGAVDDAGVIQFI